MRFESKKVLFLQILSAEGRVVGLCWDDLKPQGPQGGGEETDRAAARDAKRVVETALDLHQQNTRSFNL